MVKKIGDKSCQSNFDKQLLDFVSFLVMYVITNVKNIKAFKRFISDQLKCQSLV